MPKCSWHSCKSVPEGGGWLITPYIFEFSISSKKKRRVAAADHIYTCSSVIRPLLLGWDCILVHLANGGYYDS